MTVVPMKSILIASRVVLAGHTRERDDALFTEQSAFTTSVDLLPTFGRLLSADRDTDGLV